MTTTTLTALMPLYHHITLQRLSRWIKVWLVVRKVLVGLGALTALIIFVQFLYPANRTLPLQHLGQAKISFMTAAELQSLANTYDQHTVTLQVGSTSLPVKARIAGLKINTLALNEQLQTYSWRQRLIPGSIFFPKHVTKVPTTLDVKAATVFAQTVIDKTQVTAKNAGATRQANGTYALAPQITGQSLTLGEVIASLSTADPLLHSRVRVEPNKQAPAVTDSTVSTAILQYDRIRSAPFSLSYDGKLYTITTDQLTNWASVTIDTDKQTATVTLDQAAVRQWLSDTVPLILQAPGTSTVTTLDGVVQSRTPATSGQGIDLDATLAAINSALQGSHTAATAAIKTLSPIERYVRQYTPTGAGLQALVNQWSQSYGGLRAGVSIQELGGQNRSASLNGATQYSLASIYKMFVAWYSYNHAEGGTLDLNSPSPVAGKTITQCLRDAIVNSDNPCGEGLGNLYGWSNLNNFAHLGGYTHVDLADEVTAAPSDTAKLLVNLANGSLLNTTDTQTLLGYMGQQIYRGAIPAGSPGATVQDKVGIDPGVWNDAAIIHGPRSSYVLVVYTNGNESALKDLASQIYTLMQE